MSPASFSVSSGAPPAGHSPIEGTDMRRRHNDQTAGSRFSLALRASLLLALLVLLPTPSRAQTLLDAATHPKFVNDLPIPARIDAHKGNKNFVVEMRETTQWLGLVDDGSTPLMTTVWGYGLAGSAATYPGPTFEAKSMVPVRITWRNMLPASYSGFPGPGSHLLPVDPTLHVARPPGGGIPTVVHLHGGNTESASDGLPDSWYTQGYVDRGPGFVKQQHFYQNTQEAATLWYHDHAQGITRINVYAGLAGFYLLRDPNEDKLVRTNVLPGGSYEIEIAIQDRMFTSDGQLFVPYEDPELEDGFDPLPEDTPSIIAEFFGDFIIVNGKAWPKLNVEPRAYRFRLLNGSDSRFYVLELRNAMTGGEAQPFLQIGTDQGFLNNPVPLTSLLIGPGERADLVVDFAGLPLGTELYLRNFGPDEPFKGFEESGEVIDGPADEETTGQVMKFVVSNPLSQVPQASVSATSRLRNKPIEPLSNATRTRKLALFEGLDSYGRLMPMLGIVDPTSEFDGSLTFDDPITENPMLNDTEIWEVYNATMDAHPIHLHLVAFQILSRQAFHATLEEKDQHLHGMNGEMAMGVGGRLTDIMTHGPIRPPAPNEAGWKDTAVMLPHEVTRLVATFNREGRYVWHCHILSHEDHDMMRPYYVGPMPAMPVIASTGADDLMLAQNAPNPFNPSTVISFQLPRDQHIRLAVYDMLGRQVALVANGTYPQGHHQVLFEAPALASGMYVYRLETEHGVFARTMILMK
jgi:spore coat protein A, manganese oxidase